MSLSFVVSTFSILSAWSGRQRVENDHSVIHWISLYREFGHDFFLYTDVASHFTTTIISAGSSEGDEVFHPLALFVCVSFSRMISSFRDPATSLLHCSITNPTFVLLRLLRRLLGSMVKYVIILDKPLEISAPFPFPTLDDKWLPWDKF